MAENVNFPLKTLWLYSGKKASNKWNSLVYYYGNQLVFFKWFYKDNYRTLNIKPQNKMVNVFSHIRQPKYNKAFFHKQVTYVWKQVELQLLEISFLTTVKVRNRQCHLGPTHTMTNWSLLFSIGPVNISTLCNLCWVKIEYTAQMQH